MDGRHMFATLARVVCVQVADILHRAVDSVDTQKSSGDVTTVLNTLHNGVRMTQSTLLKTFAKHGVKVVRV